MITLQAQLREPKKNLKTIREEGNIPAIFYGYKKKSTPLTLNQKEFKKTWKEAGESSAITLKTPNGEFDALIQDIQIDPVTSIPIHADFLAIDTSKPVEVNITLEFIGESPAVKSGLGTLVKVLHDIEIKALSKDLPQEIKVDISVLKTLNDQILVKDVILPQGVTSLTKEDEVIVLVSAVKEEVVEETVPEADLSGIEVEKKGKQEELKDSEASEKTEETKADAGK